MTSLDRVPAAARPRRGSHPARSPSTVIGDLYKLEERGRAQGLMAERLGGLRRWSVPLAGGLIVDNVSWAWIFWLNIPIGFMAIAGFIALPHETVEHKAERGSTTSAPRCSAFAIVLAAHALDRDAGSALDARRVGCRLIVSALLFLRQEAGAAEPMISLPLWSRRLIATCNIATLLAGMALIGLTTVLPLYVQGVLGRSPVVAGFTLTALVVGWPLAVSLSGRFFKAFGIRNTLRGGGLMFPLGAAFLLLLTPQSQPALAGVGSSSWVSAWGC